MVEFVIYLPLAAVVGVRDIAKPIKHQLVIMTINYLEEVVVVLHVEGRPLQPRDEHPQRVQDVRHRRHGRRRHALLLLKCKSKVNSQHFAIS